MRNALIPVVTMMGLQFGFLLGGSIVVEMVFNWPGIGRLLVDAVDMRDYPVIQALVLLFSLEFILINLIVDVLYARRSIRRSATADPCHPRSPDAVDRICGRAGRRRHGRVRTPWSRVLAQVQAAAASRVVAGVFVLLLVVVAVAAPWIVPYRRRRTSSTTTGSTRGRRGSTGSASIRSGATSSAAS